MYPATLSKQVYCAPFVLTLWATRINWPKFRSFTSNGYLGKKLYAAFGQRVWPATSSSLTMFTTALGTLRSHAIQIV